MKVKFMHRGFGRDASFEYFLRQFPGNRAQWGSCHFEFDPDCGDYDWLVVFHDLPPSGGLFTEEKLACPRERTMLVTAEPSTITVYGRDYLKQFGHILTFQEPWAIRHPGAIFHHPGLTWFYGISVNNEVLMNWDQLDSMAIPEKTGLLSTVCSARTGKVTLHSSRVDFTWRLKDELPEMEIFGHGVNPMNDKAEALNPFKYHITVENHVYDHHLTEKLPDAFLGYALPFYHGAPNASDYFPKGSFIPIDIHDYSRSKDIITSVLANNEYEDRLPYIKEARRRVLEEQNLFAIVSKTIEERDRALTTVTADSVIRNRSTMRMKNPLVGVRSLSEKAITKLYHRYLSPAQHNATGKGAEEDM